MFGSLGKLRFNHSFNFTSRLFYSTRKAQTRCYYEVLQLPRNCLDKDVKEAFVNLSKQYHPDKNKHPDANAAFVELVEAYSVLGKPLARRMYDSTANINVVGNNNIPIYSPYTKTFRDEPYKDPSFYANRDKSKDDFYARQPYYGVKGVGKLSNGMVVFLCLSVVGVLVILQLVLIKTSFSWGRSAVNKKAAENAVTLNAVRAAATENGNKLQTSLLLKRIAEDSNTAASTAALGQLLANTNDQKDKKSSSTNLSSANEIIVSGS